MMENNLPDGWIECSIGEILLTKKGKKPLSTIDENRIGYVPYFLIDEMEGKPIRAYTNDPKVSIIDESDVLLVWDGSIGKCGSGMKGAIGSTFVGLKPLDSIPTKFLEYTIKQQNNFIKETSTGTGLQHINKDFFEICKIPLPPLSEQHRIVAKLDTIMQKIESNKLRLDKIPKLLKRFRQSVLVAALSGKLTEEWRSTNKKTKSNIEELINIRKKNHFEIGKRQKLLNKTVPKITDFKLLENNNLAYNWLPISVESATTFIIDCLHSTPKFTETGNLCIDTTCIEPFKILYNYARKVTTDSFIERTSRMSPEKGDILFSREGTIGTAVLYNSEYPICLGQRMMMFRFADFVSPKYAELYMGSYYFRTLFTPFISGTSAQHLNIGDIRQLEFVLPPLEEQKEIVRKVEHLFAFADKIEARYTKAKAMLDRLPQSILAKAFRGELVPQNASDEPASVLLERIKAEKVKIAEQKKSKKGIEYSIVTSPLQMVAEKKTIYKK